MSAKRKKLVELNLDQKKEVLDWLDKGVTQRCLAEEFGVAKATIVNINKNRETILKAWEDGSHRWRKRKLRKTENEPVNILVLEFLKKCRAMNIAVSGPMLQTMAKEVAQRLNLEEFQASNGWLASFKERNKVHFRNVSVCNSVQQQHVQEQTSDVDMNAAVNWRSKLEHLLKKYPPENQFNADETGLLFRKLPTRSMPLDGEHWKGEEHAKERLTILFCCSATGEKLKPLVIGNCARPAVFKKNNVQVEHLPVTWCFNRNAWMTWSIFETWVQSVNEKMKRENRSVMLLVDNATCHYGTQELSNVVVKFLPTNLTPEVQPMCQGIIREIRARYRKMMLQCLITNAGAVKNLEEFGNTVTVLDAIRWINGAWREVSVETTVKCFKRAGFYDKVQWEELKEAEIGFEETIRALPAHIQHELASGSDIVEFDNTLTLHEEVQTSADAIAEEVLCHFKGTASKAMAKGELGEEGCDLGKDESNDGEETQSRIPSHKEALQHVEHLMKYAAANRPTLVEKLLNMYTSIEVQWATAEMNSTQT